MTISVYISRKNICNFVRFQKQFTTIFCTNMELSIKLSFLSKSDDFDDKLLISQNMCIYTLNGNNCYDYFSNTMIQTIIIEPMAKYMFIQI